MLCIDRVDVMLSEKKEEGKYEFMRIVSLETSLRFLTPPRETL